MAYPSGVSLAVVTVGNAFTAFGDGVPVQVSISPKFPKQGGGFLSRIVHQPTGWVMTAEKDSFTAEAGVEVSFSVPHVDQPVWVDPALNAYTGWYYEVEIIVGNSRGRERTKYVQTVQPIVGQDIIDLDLIPDDEPGSPTWGPVPTVTSINGQTGAVTVDTNFTVTEPTPGEYVITSPSMSSTIMGLNWDKSLPQESKTNLADDIQAPATTIGAAVAAAATPIAEAEAGLVRDDLTPANGGRPVGQGEFAASVKHYGVVGDGVADDAAALNSALASPARRVVVPAGTTLGLSTSVTIPSDKTLFVESGATVMRIGTGNAQVLVLSSRSTLEGGGSIDGAGLSTSAVSVSGANVTVTGVLIAGATSYGVHNYGHADLRIQGCRFSGNGSYAALIETEGAIRPVISGNTISSGGRGFMLKEASDGVVSGNIINLTGGVAVEVFGASSKRVSITGNAITGTPIIGVSLAAATYCTVLGNSITGCTQIGMENAEGAAFNTFSGNVVNNGSGVGMALTSGSGGLKPANNVAVTGNTITKMGSYGVQAEYGRNHTITGNTIEDTTGIPIYLNNSPANCMISGNVIRLTDASTAAHMCRIMGAGNTVDGNLFDYTAKTTVSSGQHSGVLVFGGTNQNVTNNVCRAPNIGVIVNNGVGTVISGNRVEGARQYAFQFFGTNNTSTVLTNTYSLNGGVAISNSNSTTITGTLVQTA